VLLRRHPRSKGETGSGADRPGRPVRGCRETRARDTRFGSELVGAHARGRPARTGRRGRPRQNSGTPDTRSDRRAGRGPGWDTTPANPGFEVAARTLDRNTIRVTLRGDSGFPRWRRENKTTGHAERFCPSSTACAPEQNKAPARNIFSPGLSLVGLTGFEPATP
jgi:hypothetical protein